MKEAEKEGGRERDQEGQRKVLSLSLSVSLSLCSSTDVDSSTPTSSCAKAQKNESGWNYSRKEMQELKERLSCSTAMTSS